MTNQLLSKLLEEMADLLELKEDNPFRIRAFRRAALTLGSMDNDVTAMTREERLEIPGVGKGIADIIDEFKAQGSVLEHDRLKKQFPSGVLQIMRISGLGPKRAALLFKELKIDSLEKLQKAGEEKKLEILDGFGPKLQESILKSIDFVAAASKRILLSEAIILISGLKSALQNSRVIKKLDAAGSFRRWKETIGDIDLICTSQNPEQAIDEFLKKSQPVRILASGPTKASVILPGEVQCDFRVVGEKSWGAALLYFTGSKEHNIRLRELAQHKNMTLNEYGLFRLNDKKQSKPLASASEEEIYQKLGLPWIPPELREDRGEIQAGLKNNLPKLVNEDDIYGDFHNHTLLSDGKNTLEEMVIGAQQKGWTWFFSGDHSPSLQIAHGLPAAVLRQKMRTIESLNQKLKRMHVFCGSEVDILADGKMDYPDSILSELDCVVASVHSRFNLSEAEMTERICHSLKNRYVDVLGHLTGRLINRREAYSINIPQILETARNTHTAIEINGQPDRLDMSDIHVKNAIKLGVPLVLSTDAHSVKELDFMTYALHVARRGWAEPRHLLNCLSFNEILNWRQS